MGSAPFRSVLGADGERLAEPSIRFQVITVLPVAGRVLGGSEQQPIAISCGAVGVILWQADTQLLIVGIVAGLGGAPGQRIESGGPIVAGPEVGGRPVARLEGAQSDEGAVEPLEEPVGRHGLPAARG